MRQKKKNSRIVFSPLFQPVDYPRDVFVHLLFVVALEFVNDLVPVRGLGLLQYSLKYLAVDVVLELASLIAPRCQTIVQYGVAGSENYHEIEPSLGKKIGTVIVDDVPTVAHLILHAVEKLVLVQNRTLVDVVVLLQTLVVDRQFADFPPNEASLVGDAPRQRALPDARRTCDCDRLSIN